MVSGGELIILAGAGLALACFIVPGWPCNVWLTTMGAKNQAAQNQLFPPVNIPKSVPAPGGTKTAPNFTAQQKALFPSVNNITLA